MISALDDFLFDQKFNENWHMQLSERVALLYALDRARPEISVEIGTFLCGSLRPIAKASRRVYTLDIDSNQHRVSPQFSNVTFIAGDSAETLPPIIDKINSSYEEINFILVDGNHEEAGVRSDLTNCLKYKPKLRPTLILMHDSSNPAVRSGILTAPWTDCPYVHSLDLDFVPGMLYERADIKGQIWGGLAAAVMLPQVRTGALDVSALFEPSRQALIARSIYSI